MDIKIYSSGKSIDFDVKKIGFLSKGIGLMFRSSKTKCLLFEFKKDVQIGIHSYFVFFPFVAIWLNNKDKVISCEVVKPFRLTVRPQIKFRKLVEVPFNEKNYEIIDFFVGKKERFKYCKR